MNKPITALTALALSAFCFAITPAMADADDDKWIAKCVKDNKDEGAKPEVVKKYCTCMNEKMDSSESKSITEWEKSHKKEAAQCSKEAGWK